MVNCSFPGCKIFVAPNQEKTTKGLYGKPYCKDHEVQANIDAGKETDALMTPRAKVLALLARGGFEEQSVKGFFLLDSGSTKIAVNLNMGDYPNAPPAVGVLQVNGDILEEGHGILRIDGIRQEIEGILKSKGAGNGKKETPAPAVEVKHEETLTKAETGKDKKITECETGSENPEVIVPGNVIAILDKYGWKINDSAATKIIDSCDVLIDLSKLDRRGKAVEVGGYPYLLELNNVIDAELKSLFGEIAKQQSPKDIMRTNYDEVKKERTPPNMPQRPAKPDVIISAKVHSPQGTIIKGFIPQLKEIGKIKIGRKGDKKTGSGYRLPEKFDHFEIVSLIRDENGNFIPDTIMSALGEAPKELSVMLLYNDPTLNFSTRYNAYKGGRCLCSGDGESARNVAGEKLICNPDLCEPFQKKACKPNGILSVILTDSPRLGGVYKFRTTSYNSIRSILSSLFFLRSLTGGVLAMIPLTLTVSPMTVQPKDSQTAQTIYVVNVEFSGTAKSLLEKTVEVSKYQGSMRAEIQALEATARLSLNAPESEEEIRDVEAEYYPEVN